MFYIVATPLGNIEDASLRQIKTLCASDIILAEDTRSFDNFYKKTQKLFNLSPIKNQKIIPYYKEIEFEKLPWVIGKLQEDMVISLASESGLPAISDPGHVTIGQLITKGIEFTVIPGPTAFTTAVLLSGFPSDTILFLGFLPKKRSALENLFHQLETNKSKHINPTVVFYESPHRINKTLEIIGEILPETQVAICREMTKKFEEVIRGKPSELAAKKYKGELTVVLG